VSVPLVSNEKIIVIGVFAGNVAEVMVAKSLAEARTSVSAYSFWPVLAYVAVENPLNKPSEAVTFPLLLPKAIVPVELVVVGVTTGGRRRVIKTMNVVDHIGVGGHINNMRSGKALDFDLGRSHVHKEHGG
jgi:hypothetical protein